MLHFLKADAENHDRREIGFPQNKEWRLAKEFLFVRMVYFKEMLSPNKNERTMTI